MKLVSPVLSFTSCYLLLLFLFLLLLRAVGSFSVTQYFGLSYSNKDSYLYDIKVIWLWCQIFVREVHIECWRDRDSSFEWQNNTRKLLVSFDRRCFFCRGRYQCGGICGLPLDMWKMSQIWLPAAPG